MVIGENQNLIPPVGGSEPTKPERLDRQRVKRGDIVDISGNAAGKTENAGQVPGGDLDRLESSVGKIRTEIRQRVKSGFYGKEEVVSRVARKLLELFGL